MSIYCCISFNMLVFRSDHHDIVTALLSTSEHFAIIDAGGSVRSEVLVLVSGWVGGRCLIGLL